MSRQLQPVYRGIRQAFEDLSSYVQGKYYRDG